jgi:hypothetical protein
MNAIVESHSAALVAPQQSGMADLSPRNFEQALEFSRYLADSEMVPKDFRGKPGNCLIAMQWGAEIGLKPLQALQNLAIINGRPNLWGDAVIALVRASPLCKYVIEEDDGTTATCRTWRVGAPAEQVERFSVDDAKTAGLLGKQGPWTQYPKRMRKMRARAFLLRDVYADVLRGLPIAEETLDAPPERHLGMADEVRPAEKPALPAYGQADFEKNLPAWTKVVADGKKTAPELLAMLSTKATFSEEQKARILTLKKRERPGDAPLTEQQPAATAEPATAASADPFVAEMEAAEGGAQ